MHTELYGFVVNRCGGIFFVAFEDGCEGLIGDSKTPARELLKVGDFLRCEAGAPEYAHESTSATTQRRQIYQYQKQPHAASFGLLEVAEKGMAVLKCRCHLDSIGGTSRNRYPVFTNRHMHEIHDIDSRTPPAKSLSTPEKFWDTEFLVAVVRTRIPGRNGESGWIVRELLGSRSTRQDAVTDDGRRIGPTWDGIIEGDSGRVAPETEIRPLIPELESYRSPEKLKTRQYDGRDDEASTSSINSRISGRIRKSRQATAELSRVPLGSIRPSPKLPEVNVRTRGQPEARDEPGTSETPRSPAKTSSKQRIRGVCVKTWGHYRILWLYDGRMAVYDSREWPHQGELGVQLGRFYEVFVAELDAPVLDKKLSYGWKITDFQAIPDIHQPIVDDKKANFRCRNLVFTSYRQEANKRVPILHDEFFGEIPDRNEILADPAPGDKFHVVIRAVPKSESGLEWIIHSDFIEEERPSVAVVPPFDQMRRNSLESTTLPYDQRSVSSSRTNDELSRINDSRSTPKNEAQSIAGFTENFELPFDESTHREPEVADKYLALADLMLK
ncbi:unnamed protein product, partial [Mesorhabditis spiculigera]